KPEQKIQTEALKPVTLDKPKKRSKKKDSEKEEAKQTLIVRKPVKPGFQWSLIYPLLLEKAPLFALTILSSIATYVAADSAGAVHSKAIPLVVRVGNTFVSYIAYIGKMILPINLAVLYPHPGSVVLWQVFGAAVLLFAITFVVIWKVKKFPYLATGWFWYVGTLVPVIGIVQVGAQALADRYTYIPLIGLFIMIAWGIPDLLNKVNRRKEMLLALSVLCILFLSLLTWRQVGYWKNSLILFDHTLKVTDNNWFAYKSRGNVYYDLGDYRSAIADYDKALQITSRYAEAYNNRGTAYIKLGDCKQAIADLNRALEIKPAYADAYNGRCTVNHILGNYGQAIADCSRAIEIKPDFATAYNNRGNAYNALGNFKLAIENYSKAIEIKPVYAEAYYNRGSAYNSLGNYQRSIADLNRAVEIKPDYPEAYINRGYAYKGLGNYSQAIENFGRAIEIKPDYAYAYLNRSAAYASLGKNDLAVQDLKMAAKYGDERARDVLKRKGINW
ncbi:MAG TPA: tetratricopeptide repeat protein, partial [Smithellaceae bacterium]|nr:tetratricopeptide repeat protein [Smithellaceae bacterium]